jgi:putative nucleotidyltransferase with HDIG domain
VRKPVKGYDMESDGLWHHSIATAICAEQLAKSLKLVNAEEAFTAGLLHDMGKILLGTFVEIDDEPIKELVQTQSLSFNEAERQVLGIDHAEAAAELLQYWKLPDNVVAAARWHHSPDQAEEQHRSIVDLVHVADILCTRMGWGIGTDGPLYCLNEEAEERLGIDAQVEDEVTDKVGAAIDDLKNILQPKSEPVLS